jgi:DNA-binding response OmpR family regulator
MPQGTQVTTTTPGTAGIPPVAAPRRGGILIVEDRDDVRQGLAQLLELHGYLVFEASNAAETFAHFEASPGGIALILLDLVLPGPSGAAIRATQLADPRLSGIPTIIVSAYAPDIPYGAALRATAWFEKPFRFDQLLDEVRKHVAT